MRKILKILALNLLVVLGGCASSKYSYHSVYKLTDCKNSVSRERVMEELVHRGYLHSAETKGPLDIYHRPSIEKKGRFAQEPYEDKSGDIAVAVCDGGSENFVLTEEWTHCKNNKDCTKENQKDLRKLAEGWGCQVSESSGHSESWNLENRQDWTKESCSAISTKLAL